MTPSCVDQGSVTMPKMDFNNINLRYRGYKISIAQHTGGDMPALQEVAFWPEDKDIRNATQDAEVVIYPYGKSLTNFMQTMQIVMEDIDNLTKSED